MGGIKRGNDHEKKKLSQMIMQPFDLSSDCCSAPFCVPILISNRHLLDRTHKESGCHEPHNTIFNTMRLIGCKFVDADIQADMKHFSFKVINKGEQPSIEVEYKG